MKHESVRGLEGDLKREIWNDREFQDVRFSMPCQVVIYPVGNEGLTKKIIRRCQ